MKYWRISKDVLFVFAQVFCLMHINLLWFNKTELPKPWPSYLLLLRAWLLHERHTDMCCCHCPYFCRLLNSSALLPHLQWFFFFSVFLLYFSHFHKCCAFSTSCSPHPLSAIFFLFLSLLLCSLLCFLLLPSFFLSFYYALFLFCSILFPSSPLSTLVPLCWVIACFF